MARKRMIHPNFFTSRTMNELPIRTMVTFEGIWCWADDYGRGENDAALVKASVWPRRKAVTEKIVRDDMDVLTKLETLCAYEVAGVSLIHVVSWNEHQKVSHPTDSKLPPCPTHEAAAWEEFLTSSDPALHKFRVGSGAFREILASESRATPSQCS